MREPCLDPSGDQPIIIQVQPFINRFGGNGRSHDLGILKKYKEPIFNNFKIVFSNPATCSQWRKFMLEELDSVKWLQIPTANRRCAGKMFTNSVQAKPACTLHCSCRNCFISTLLHKMSSSLLGCSMRIRLVNLSDVIC